MWNVIFKVWFLLENQFISLPKIITCTKSANPLATTKAGGSNELSFKHPATIVNTLYTRIPKEVITIKRSVLSSEPAIQKILY